MDGKGSQVVCSLQGRQLRFQVPQAESEREERRQWRVLLMRVKLRWEEFVSAEVSFDEAFLSFIVGPDNRMMAEHFVPCIEQAYRSGRVEALRLEW